MVGTGAVESECRELAAELGVSGRIVWHGAVERAARLLPAFDVLLITSWTEGTPMVLLEAMAAGVPVVSTAVGGIPDVVSREEALLVPAGDVQAMARALDDVLADPEAAIRRASVAALRLEREFAVEPWVERYRTVYESTLAARATP
jgi:glycosyltransferase involved in cell wall biosynthesis